MKLHHIFFPPNGGEWNKKHGDKIFVIKNKEYEKWK
jgi:hypothetical protein